MRSMGTALCPPPPRPPLRALAPTSHLLPLLVPFPSACVASPQGPRSAFCFGGLRRRHDAPRHLLVAGGRGAARSRWRWQRRRRLAVPGDGGGSGRHHPLHPWVPPRRRPCGLARLDLFVRGGGGGGGGSDRAMAGARDDGAGGCPPAPAADVDVGAGTSPLKPSALCSCPRGGGAAAVHRGTPRPRATTTHAAHSQSAGGGQGGRPRDRRWQRQCRWWQRWWWQR